MIVTMLEARVAEGRENSLEEAYRSIITDAEIPPAIVETFLLHEEESDVWRIMTVWRSREELVTYRTSGQTPAGIRTFRAAGVEPTLSLNEVVIHKTR
jgi:hypothetical protein